ncbi:MAG: alpha/beta fold hydrolase [Actinomycetota bacterium]
MSESAGESIARGSFLPLGPARLYIREVGYGQPIIIVHGGPDFDHEYLLPDMDRLAEFFRLVYYDQRGRGRSADGVKPEDVTIISEVGDLEAVRLHLGLDRTAVLGHSWGGLVAMEYAIRYPDQVSHLVLMNTAPASHQDYLMFRDHLRARRSPDDVAEMERLRSSSEYQQGDLDVDAEYNRRHFKNAVAHPEYVDLVVGRLRTHFTPETLRLARAIEQHLYEQTWELPDYDLLSELSQLRIPALVIHGAQDFIPIDIARHIAASMPGARLIVLANCGHFAYLEQPKRVGSSITEFLRQAGL